jgi:hypothetical protein
MKTRVAIIARTLLSATIALFGVGGDLDFVALSANKNPREAGMK